MPDSLDRLFLDFSIARLRQYSSEIEKCLGLLTDQQIWTRRGDNENAVGNLVLHLCGNVRQRIGAIAGRPFARAREEEFSARDGLSAVELTGRLQFAVGEAIDVLATLTPDRLVDRVAIAEFNQAVIEAIYHMEVHFALHSGQIFYATKLMTGADLGFYKPPKPAAGRAS